MLSVHVLVIPNKAATQGYWSRLVLRLAADGEALESASQCYSVGLTFSSGKRMFQLLFVWRRDSKWKVLLESLS